MPEITWPQRLNRYVVTTQFIVAVSAGILGIASAVLKNTLAPAPDIAQQLDALNQTSESLKSLTAFVEEQKRNLVESEALIKSLREEHEKLKPVVETDRKILDAVLAAQAERQRLDVWRERIWGIFIGAIGSLLAAFLTFLLVRGIASIKAKKQQAG
jgi:hypothetical protein